MLRIVSDSDSRFRREPPASHVYSKLASAVNRLEAARIACTTATARYSASRDEMAAARARLARLLMAVSIAGAVALAGLVLLGR